jgi:hypothetical protein
MVHKHLAHLKLHWCVFQSWVELGKKMKVIFGKEKLSFEFECGSESEYESMGHRHLKLTSWLTPIGVK